MECVHVCVSERPRKERQTGGGLRLDLEWSMSDSLGVHRTSKYWVPYYSPCSRAFVA